jgi:hypothetical protein
MTGLEERTLQRALKKLAELKYVFIEYVNNNSAMRRIYVVLDNPKKLEYLAKKGMFSMSPNPAVADAEPKNEEPEMPKPTTRPKRADYSSDEEYEKAFYKWNSR